MIKQLPNGITAEIKHGVLTLTTVSSPEAGVSLTQEVMLTYEAWLELRYEVDKYVDRDGGF